MNILEIIKKLKEFAQVRKQEKKDGSYYSCHLPDYAFNQIVPEELENEVMELMVSSNEWFRHLDGFDLIK